MDLRLADVVGLDPNETWIQVDTSDDRLYITLSELEASIKKIKAEKRKRDKARREAYKQASLEG